MESMTEKERAERLTVFFDSLNEEKKGFSSLAELLQYKLLVIEKQKGKIIGISAVGPRNILFLRVVPKNLLFLIVKSGYQNRGIGQKLVKKVIQKAIRRNYSYLALYVNRSNSKAIHIYLKLGFRKVYSPFMGTRYFMMLPLNLLGWLFFPLLYIYFFITPLKDLLKIICDLFKSTN
jgi:ribosomal protein S18 acetylase RimI-like enzyme